MPPPHSMRAALVAMVLVFGTVQAQEDAARIEKRFEKTPEPQSTLRPLVFPIDERQPPEKAGEIRFVLNEIRLSGNTAYATSDLASLWSGQIGREISLLDIYKLRDAITAHYGNAGFGLSKALIPEQRIQSDGIVQIDILEGFIDEVVVEGDPGRAREYLEHAIERIKAERPANARTLERYLLLANDRFAIKVTSTMRKSDKTPAASTLILKVETAPMLDGGASIDNRGTESVGKTQINADISLNGLFGRASKTTLGYATVEQGSELQYWSLTHTEILGNEGTSWALGYTNSLSKPGTRALRLLDQQSDSEGWSLKIAHPFIRTRQENLTAHVKYDQKNTESESLNTTTSLDRIRSIRIGINYDKADAYEGINQVLAEYSLGLKNWGASENGSALKSRADGRFDYQKLTLNLSRKQELSYFSPDLSRFSVNMALMGQYTGTGLLSTEECGLGGSQFGRAYDSSEITGDRCLAASLEMRYALDTEGSLLQYAQLYAFYDGGYVNNENPTGVGMPKTTSLSSSGLGVRFGVSKHASGHIEYTQPLTRDVANEGDRKSRVFASLSMRF